VSTVPVHQQTIAVPEIHCDHCKTSIEGAVAPLEGVRHVAVDVEDRTVTVEFDLARTDINAVVDAIREQGYEVPEEQLG
jgi:copper chaperone